MSYPFLIFGFRSFPMPLRILKTDTQENLQIAIKEAKDVILTGGVVAVPTESFYGLAVNALNEKAIERLLAIKKRREDHPVLILIHSADVLERYVVQVPPVALHLIEAFWPGGLTMVFEAKPVLPLLLTGGTGKIGVRLSSHPVPTELASVAGVAITGTSANVTGEPPCESPEDVIEALGSQVDIILDGGKTAGGRGSTVLDVTVAPPVILREGMVPRKLLMPFLGPLHPTNSHE
jgi:L-threonylcarbamoyladenylate synthase